jgi:cell division initiation protein
MSYTPVELRHVRVGRSLFGYNRAMVEQLIEEVAHSFEATWRERGELAEKVEALEKQIEEHRQREHLLTQTLIAAEQAASDVKDRARREAEAIIQEAHTEARAVARQAQSERERLVTESRRIEGMLRAALGAVGEGIAGALPEGVPDSPEAGQPALATPASSAPLHALPTVVNKPVEKQLPPLTRESLPGWPREEPREFPAFGSGEAEQSKTPQQEPDRPQGTRDDKSSASVGGRILAAGSADFDWGE